MGVVPWGKDITQDIFIEGCDFNSRTAWERKGRRMQIACVCQFCAAVKWEGLFSYGEGVGFDFGAEGCYLGGCCVCFQEGVVYVAGYLRW